MQLAGANIVITGTQAVTGTIPNQAANNCSLATLSHGPFSGVPAIYFVTLTRLHCVATSAITAGSTTFISAANVRQEIPPGGIITFPASGNMMNVQNIDFIDCLIISTFGAGAAFRQYITKYPATDTTPFNHVFGVDDKQQDQSFLSSQAVVHFNTSSQLLSCDANNGVVHISRNGATAALNQVYALPIGAHWTYASTTGQRVISPSLDTTGCIKFDQLIVVNDKFMGAGELSLPTEPYRVYYRTSDITSDATSSWVLANDLGDLSSVPPANAIQFMFEFFTIGATCLPAKIMEIVVTYEDGLTDSHYQLSSSLSDITNERFAWRFYQRFGSDVPNLKVELFNATTGSSLLSDTTESPASGVWQKSINGGTSWSAYDTIDVLNDDTYIRYSPTVLTDNIAVRALLTQN